MSDVLSKLILSATNIGEIKSVYVRNLSPSISASEIEEEFKKFGQLTTEGVAIRRLKVNICIPLFFFSVFTMKFEIFKVLIWCLM